MLVAGKNSSGGNLGERRLFALSLFNPPLVYVDMTMRRGCPYCEQDNRITRTIFSAEFGNPFFVL